MSDDPSIEPTDGGRSDSPGEAESGTYHESELDAMLLEASSLAAELAEESGTRDPEGALEEAKRSLLDGDDIAAKVDDQLAEVDQLIDAAGGELGVDAGAEVAGGAEPAVEDESAAGAEATEVPADAQEEPGSPAAPPQGGVSEASTGAAVSSGIGVSEEELASAGMLGGDDAIPDFGGDDDSASKDGSAGHQPRQRRDHQVGSTESGRAPVPADAAGRFLPMALGVCARGVGLLEVIDRPIQRVPPFVKQVVGYVALVTVGTSLLLLLISLF